MNTRMLSGLALPILLLLAGCPGSGGGGAGGFEGTVAAGIAYVSNSGSNDVSAYTINTTTGALTPVAGSPFPAGGTSPQAVTVALNGTVAYVVNGGASNNVTAFTIGAGGVLTLVPSTVANPNPVPVGGTTPNGVTVSPNGQFLYVSNGGGAVTAFTIGAGGVLTLVPSTVANPNPITAGTTPNGITIEPNGQFLYVANGGGNVSAYAIGAGTGALTPLGVGLGNPFPAGSNPSGIATPGRP
jgi:6-phosphogluconolactonase